jgi:hypothetical protein
MAKRKDSVALFEVITAAKKKQEAAAAASMTPRERPGVLRTPKWWFKKSKTPGGDVDGAYAAPALPSPSSVSTITPAPQLSAPSPLTEVVAPAPALVQRVAQPERVTIPERRAEGDPFGLEGPNHPSAKSGHSWLGRTLGRKVNVDPNRREVTFRIRYTTALLLGFAACVLIALIVIAVRQPGRQTARASGAAVSSAQVKRGPILAGVLEPHVNGNVASKNQETTDDDTTPETPPPSNSDKSRVQDKPKPIEKPTAPHATPGGVEIGLPRTIGLNYVLIQSYPEEKMALDAQKALEAAEIPTTVQKTPAGWSNNPDLYCVIGTYGFPRRYESLPEYREYIKKIEQVSKSFAGKSKMKSFSPGGYKWRAESTR